MKIYNSCRVKYPNLEQKYKSFLQNTTKLGDCERQEYCIHRFHLKYIS